MKARVLCEAFAPYLKPVEIEGVILPMSAITGIEYPTTGKQDGRDPVAISLVTTNVGFFCVHFCLEIRMLSSTY